MRPGRWIVLGRSWLAQPPAGAAPAGRLQLDAPVLDRRSWDVGARAAQHTQAVASSRRGDRWPDAGLRDSAPVRLVIARCSVDYDGRLTAHLPIAIRLIMVKADGCVAIHADGGAYKPLNWMNAPNALVEATAARRGRSPTPRASGSTIRFEEVLSDIAHELGADPGLAEGRRRGPAAGAARRPPRTPSPTGLVLVRREYPTDIGPVDLLCRDADGRAVAVEVKRRGEIDGVEQLTRYVERLDRDPRCARCAACSSRRSIKPQARVLAEARGIRCVEVDYDELRGMRPTTSRSSDARFSRRRLHVAHRSLRCS